MGGDGREKGPPGDIFDQPHSEIGLFGVLGYLDTAMCQEGVWYIYDWDTGSLILV